MTSRANALKIVREVARNSTNRDLLMVLKILSREADKRINLALKLKRRLIRREVGIPTTR